LKKLKIYGTFFVLFAVNTIFFVNCNSGKFESLSGLGHESSEQSSRSENLESLTFVDKPPVLINTTELAVRFSTIGNNLILTCMLDGDLLPDCIDSVSLSNLNEGEHSLDIKAHDANGVLLSAIKHVFKVDSTPPTVRVNKAPASNISVNSTTVNFDVFDEVSGVEKVECSLDSGAFAPCQSPVNLENLQEKSYRFSIRAKDMAENVSSAVEVLFRVNSSAPMVTLQSYPAAVSNSSSAQFVFAGSSPTGINIISSVCDLDGQAAACSSPKTYENLKDGERVFQVKITDASGLSSTAMYRWVIDTRPLNPPPVAFYPIEQIVKTQATLNSMPMPSYMTPIIDKSTGNYYTRITDGVAFADSSTALRHHYAKNQPWNSDGTLLYLKKNNPGFLLDGKSFKFLRKVNTPAHPLWSNLNPHIMYGLSGTSLVKFDVITGASTTVRNFSSYTNVQFGPYEGNLSANDKYICITGYKSTGMELLTYNISNNTIEGTLNLPGGSESDLDWCSMSQSGNYVIIEMKTKTFAPDGKCGIKVYDRQMNFKRHLVSTCGGHADMGYDTNGNEVVVTQDASGDASLNSYRLSDGTKRVELTASSLAFNIHVSCRNLKRPGYCYISTYAHTSGRDRYLYREIFSIKLNGTGTIERFAQAHFDESVSSTAYEASSMAVPNREGSIVLWASEWEKATNKINAFISSAFKPF